MAEDLDPATAAAILIVQLQDLEELNDDKNNAPGTGDNNEAHALRVYHEELKRQIAHLRDHQIATRFGESPLGNEELPLMLPPIIPTFNAVRCDSAEKECLTPSSGKDQPSEQSKTPPSPDVLGRGRSATEEDRLSRKRKASSPPPSTCKIPRLSDSPSEVLSPPPETSGPPLEVSSSPLAVSKPGIEDLACTACMNQNESSDSAQLSCGHNWCLECIMRLFKIAMTDDALFPPQCCGVQIPLANIESQVPVDFEAAFRGRQNEMHTPASKRIYCSSQVCSTFLSPTGNDIQRNKACCPKCQTETCVTCKSVAHESSYCPEDPTVVSLMEIVKSEGYRQCPSCHQVIELTFGCHHMTYVRISRSMYRYQR